MAEQEEDSRDGRPSPDALLAAAAERRGGRFKIFFGAAPGVGKTYEMLQTARADLAKGVDVVVGVVETHGRVETAALVAGLEVLPRREVEYKGRMLEEMDIDAILRRRPALVLVDELAHTNVPGSRHPKRYQDVEELLDAGIDVYSTLNVQHLESLNDVVAQITRIRVRETVPDSVVARADEIEVIDVTPETLTKRLAEGKVYVREQAQRALKHYFSPGNLTALRELALRRTAERVDDQMLDYMRAHAIEGPWAAGERILVCVGVDAQSASLVRYGRRVADRLKAPWMALHIEPDRTTALNEADKSAVADTMRLAERLGAKAITITGRDIVDDILAYARANNITHLVLGRPGRRRWALFHGLSTVHDLVERASGMSVHVISVDEETPVQAGAGGGAAAMVKAKTAQPDRRFDPLPYLASVLMTALATGVSYGLSKIISAPNLSLVYLVAVLFSALRYGLVLSVFTSLLSVAAYNFFFLPPLYTFTIADPANVVSLLFFLAVALITSNLTTQVQRHSRLTAERARSTEEMYAFSRKLAGIGIQDDLLWAVVYQVAAMLKVQVVILTPEPDGRLAVSAAYPPEDILDEADLAAAQWTWSSNRAAGRGADTLPGARRLFLPIQTGRGVMGVLGVESERLLGADERRLLDALLDQAAVAIERIRLAEDVDKARLQTEAERLRNALLTSVSHDLRTPLATIIGSLTSLRSFGEGYDPDSRTELLTRSIDEADRLNRFVGNLLDMTRLEAGGLTPKRDPVDLTDVVGVAVERASRLLVGHRIELDLTEDAPLVLGDAVLLEQVLFNLIDNAAKYAPVETRIRIAARHGGGRVKITVEDEGPGIPADALERVFDKFTRLEAGDRQRAGTGLGLQICRGFVTAMGGTIVAGNRADRIGAVFTITLPVLAEGLPAERKETYGDA
jgi:two-component system sensor histidine kinase KdpD